jgi:cell division protein FtsL
MYDDLRNLTDKEATFEEQAATESYKEPTLQKRMFGMTAGQRLLLSILLLAAVIVMGVMVLLVTSRIWPY